MPFKSDEEAGGHGSGMARFGPVGGQEWGEAKGR